MRKCLLVLIFCLLWVDAWAATHYASPSGSASWANSTNIESPCSAATAFSNAKAGDLVLFRGGTYSVPAHSSGDTYVGVYNFTASGTGDADENRIIFRAYEGETPVLNGTMTGSGEGHCYATLIGTNGYDYITIDGFTFQVDEGDAMARIFIGGQSGTSTNVKVMNCEFDGGTPCSDQDNNEGIRVENANYTTISNCVFHDYQSTGTYRGINGIKSYTSSYLTVEGCEFYDNMGAIYAKSYGDHHTYRYNYIHDCRVGIEASTNSHYQTYGNIYHNIVAHFNIAGIKIHGESDDINGWHIYNNTLYTTSSVSDPAPFLLKANSAALDASDIQVYNNVLQIRNGGEGTNVQYYLIDLSVCDYNNYSNYIDGMFVDGGGASYFTSLSQLRAIDFGDLNANNHDMHSVAETTGFKNTSGTMSAIADFEITSGDANNGGSDGKDMGADVTLVGTGAEGGEDPPAPSGTATIRASGTAGWR